MQRMIIFSVALAMAVLAGTPFNPVIHKNDPSYYAQYERGDAIAEARKVQEPAEVPTPEPEPVPEPKSDPVPVVIPDTGSEMKSDPVIVPEEKPLTPQDESYWVDPYDQDDYDAEDDPDMEPEDYDFSGVSYEIQETNSDPVEPELSSEPKSDSECPVCDCECPVCNPPETTEIREAYVYEMFPDEEDTGFQYVYVSVTGGDADGNIYEFHPSIRNYYLDDELIKLMFDTKGTDDVTDDEILYEVQ